MIINIIQDDIKEWNNYCDNINQWNKVIYELNHDNLNNIAFYGIPKECKDYLLKHKDFNINDNYFIITKTHLKTFNNVYEIINIKELNRYLKMNR